MKRRVSRSVLEPSVKDIIFGFIWATLFAAGSIIFGRYACAKFNLPTFVKVTYLVVVIIFGLNFYLDAIDTYKLWKENKVI